MILELSPLSKKRERLDVFLVDKGFFQSRTRAQAAIMEGTVLVNNFKVTKPGSPVEEDAEIRILGEQLAYVSRGGLKLEKAVSVFGISFEGKTVLDIGASTGGFTDCALQKGAQKIYALDVGYGQLAWKLRNDPRVVNMERMNARYLVQSDIGEQVDIITMDVSFISLEKLAGISAALLKDGGEMVALIKPQFEAGREKVGKKGVVRDPAVHLEVLEHFLIHAKENHFTVLGITYSPIRGPEGNIEYLGFLRKSEEPDAAVDLQAIVEASHTALKE